MKKIIQISDSHLFQNNDLTLFSVKSNFRFEKVLSQIISNESIDTDLILITGDISQDETPESYQVIADHLDKLNIPIFWIPGNHDNLSVMQSTFQNTKNFNYVKFLSLPYWHLIFINTKLINSDSGFLHPDELNTLSLELEKAPANKKLVIIMHHHPIPVGTPLIDKYILQNRKEFLNILPTDKDILILCGHVHGDYKIIQNNITLETCPATCLQWKKGTSTIDIEHNIGYKVFYLNETDYTSATKLWIADESCFTE
jgi:Icc protein